MTMTLFAWLMTIGVISPHTTPAFECPLVGIEWARDESTLVFEGYATAVESMEPTLQIKGTIRVLQIWKGDPGRKIEVFYRGGDPDSGPIHLGQLRIFFARKMRDTDNRLDGRDPGSDPGPWRDVWLPACSRVRVPRGDDYQRLGPGKKIEWPDMR